MARTPKPWYRASRDTWCVILDGKTVVLARGKGAKREAEAEFHRIMASRALAVPLDSPRQTVASVFDAYASHAKGTLGARSYAERHRLWVEFLAYYADLPVEGLKAIHLQRWLDTRPWGSDWTRSHAVAVIKRPLNWAVRMGMIASNPLSAVSAPRGRPRRPMTREEFAALLRGAAGRKGRHFRQVAAMLRMTGMRPGEVSALRWSDLDLERGVIVLVEHKTARRMGKPRVIPITAGVARLLARRRVESAGREHVFLNANRLPWTRSSLSLRLQRARKRSGIPPEAKLYGLRHAFGTGAIVRGVDIKTLAVLMGHASTRMTEHYLHLAGEVEHLSAAMRRAASPRRSSPSREGESSGGASELVRRIREASSDSDQGKRRRRRGRSGSSPES